MAKAEDTSSTMIWLRDALTLAVRAIGSVVLAKALLTEWLATGKLPWSCMTWNPVDAEGIEELVDRARELWMLPKNIPPACRAGEPEFWRFEHTISWEDNMAGQNSVVGARALGIKVSLEHLVELLPEEPRERAEALEQTKPVEPLVEPEARPTSTTASKKTRPQSERAERYIKKNFPGGTEGITTAKIREKLAHDKDLQTELKELGRELFSATVINRVLGRRK